MAGERHGHGMLCVNRHQIFFTFLGYRLKQMVLNLRKFFCLILEYFSIYNSEKAVNLINVFGTSSNSLDNGVVLWLNY
jgi:hypothetical protein